MADPQAQPKPRLPNAYTLDPNRKNGPFGGKGDHDNDGNVGGAKAAPAKKSAPRRAK